MKRLVLGVLTFSLILGLSGCSDDESSDSENNIKKYSELPTKKDLSYFGSPQNIAGQIILRTDKSPLSNYEKVKNLVVIEILEKKNYKIS